MPNAMMFKGTAKPRRNRMRQFSISASMTDQARLVAALVYINNRIAVIDRHVRENHPSQTLATMRAELVAVKLVLQGDREQRTSQRL